MSKYKGLGAPANQNCSMGKPGEILQHLFSSVAVVEKELFPWSYVSLSKQQNVRFAFVFKNLGL